MKIHPQRKGEKELGNDMLLCQLLIDKIEFVSRKSHVKLTGKLKRRHAKIGCRTLAHKITRPAFLNTLISGVQHQVIVYIYMHNIKFIYILA